MAWSGNGRWTRIVAGTAVMLLVAGSLSAQEPGWLQDDLPAALKQAKQDGKPVFIVFR
jgi:hypothetical protein